MKQKSLKYGLIAAVALVWGLIIYRVIKGLSGEDTPIAITTQVKKLDYTTPADSFVLFANYGDPFQPAGDEEEDSLSLPSPIPSQAPVLTTPPPTQFDIKTIQYNGMMSNPENKKKIAIISIGGKDYLAKEKEKIEGVTIKKITPDDIIVIVNGKTETIVKSRN